MLLNNNVQEHFFLLWGKIMMKRVHHRNDLCFQNNQE